MDGMLKWHLMLMNMHLIQSFNKFILLILLAVFHVTDIEGNKLTDQGVISYLEKVINRSEPQLILICFH